MNKTSDLGIDYSGGTGVNRNKKTGIRFGVIPQGEVLQAWADSSEPDYGQPGELECPHCGKTNDSALRWGEEIECECGESFEAEVPDMAEPQGFNYEGDGYVCEQFDTPDIFVEESPYFTYAQFCSPCAPGACYLLNPLDTTEPENTPDGVSFHDVFQNNKCYCFGHDWFESGVAPYPVYSVETGQLVQPK